VKDQLQLAARHRRKSSGREGQSKDGSGQGSGPSPTVREGAIGDALTPKGSSKPSSSSAVAFQSIFAPPHFSHVAVLDSIFRFLCPYSPILRNRRLPSRWRCRPPGERSNYTNRTLYYPLHLYSESKRRKRMTSSQDHDVKLAALWCIKVNLLN
jgi:hypothetical protein